MTLSQLNHAPRAYKVPSTLPCMKKRAYMCFFFFVKVSFDDHFEASREHVSNWWIMWLLLCANTGWSPSLYTYIIANFPFAYLETNSFLQLLYNQGKMSPYSIDGCFCLSIPMRHGHLTVMQTIFFALYPTSFFLPFILLFISFIITLIGIKYVRSIPPVHIHP